LSPGEAAVTLRAITSNRWEHLGLPSKKRLPQRME
jgi:hypothetical protein